ncbi:MAG: NAD-dependent epimerase/dehydratase family protein [Thermodesulfobacteriota bacterium]
MVKRRKLADLIIGPTASIRQAMKAIQKNGLRGVFVCDENRELLGIVMDPDIRRAILKNIDIGNSVKTIMNTSPFTVSADLPPEGQKTQVLASEKMLVPVVDRAGRVVDYFYFLELVKQKTYSQANHQGILPPAPVLVIGGAGYIGSMLVDKLLRIGHRVRVLDLLLYNSEGIQPFKGHENFEFIRGDCRNKSILFKALEGMAAVVHLGEIVGDPACKVNEDFTIDTNFMATHRLVHACIKMQVPRFIFTSSCSVYGINDGFMDEESELQPVSLYARCKIECERAILSHRYDNFCPTILRVATVHGKSHRQRFDLVVNLLTIKGLVEKKIQIFGGRQWRPFIAVRDVANAIVAVLHSEKSKVQNQIFNLGDSRENYTIAQAGEIVKKHLPDIEIEYQANQDDPRDYRVSFEKIKKTLGFTSERNLADTVSEITSAYRDQKLYADYRDPKYHNLLSLK